MPKLAFQMKLFPGMEAEYKKRHDAIWPELVDLLHAHGISDYSIFLNKQNLLLFAVLHCADPIKIDELPNHPVMKRWWDYMKDIMESNIDHSPVSIPLQEVFYLP